jgi:hypothetical protein
VLLFSNTGLLLTGAIAVILYCIAAFIFP